jgi:hypothetical protein
VFHQAAEWEFSRDECQSDHAACGKLTACGPATINARPRRQPFPRRQIRDLPVVTSFDRRIARVTYYLRNIARDAAPKAFFRTKLEKLLYEASALDQQALCERVDYYNRLSEPFEVENEARTIRQIPLKSSMYYYDLKEHLRYFDDTFRCHYLFGDITFVPPRPSFVKSRPVARPNANSVLLNLDKFRHFQTVRDPVPFARKIPVAVWRGDANNPMRMAMVKAVSDLPGFDVGFSSGRNVEQFLRPRMSVSDQLRHRYIISIEGNDVATNLKWIFSSNSLCVMPPPKFETWFMEGSVEPGVHYAAVKHDFSDLAETIAYYEANPDEAAAIVGNASAYLRRFLDPKLEQLVSLLVLYRYFVLSGQMEPLDELSAFAKAPSPVTPSASPRPSARNR